ncbi:KH domain-containing protein At3g08620-like isoform X2 [Andrographis paniculata]|uniref:KH domain-containing protein At3g08620-like isoform X2 n=1 Tax=Andrographis paniculata TaxID=175694 RepID=UPI0021E979BD|nr:KH domain-containing protein At3g08620-like isoform X2 [Andrographis paniculata]
MALGAVTFANGQPLAVVACFHGLRGYSVYTGIDYGLIYHFIPPRFSGKFPMNVLILWKLCISRDCMANANGSLGGFKEKCWEYLAELLEEMQKLGPFKQVFPICDRLLDQEITKVSGMFASKVFEDYDKLQLSSRSPLASMNVMPDVGGSSNWNGNGSHTIKPEILRGPHCMTMDRQTAQGDPDLFSVRRVLRLDIPVDKYPDYNFVGRLLGPRGNSLKRVEASTGCRIYIRGRGSVKDPNKEEKLRGKPGYEHLNEPLHILIEAESPANFSDGRLMQAKEILEERLIPVDDEAQDYYKKEQLRELAMIKNSRAQSPQPSGSLSPSVSNGKKHLNDPKQTR